MQYEIFMLWLLWKTQTAAFGEVAVIGTLLNLLSAEQLQSGSDLVNYVQVLNMLLFEYKPKLTPQWKYRRLLSLNEPLFWPLFVTVQVAQTLVKMYCK